MKFQNRAFGITAALAGLFALTPAVWAQSPQGTVPLVVRKYKVKPGSVRAFEEVVRKYRDAFKDQGRAFYMTWRTSMGDSYEYTVLAAIPGIVAFDSPSPLIKAFGERDAMEIGYRMAQFVDGTTQQLWHLHREQSIWSAQDFKGARITEIGLRNAEAGREHSRVQEPVVAKLREAGRKNYWTVHLDYGGDDFRALMITPFDTYGELEQPLSLSKLVGPEEAKKIVAIRDKTTRFRNVYLWSYRPDLSYRSAELPK